MTKVKNFAKKDIDLEIHLRTGMVRYWSYVKTAAIRIGNDVLEVEGSAAQADGQDKRHYHINFEYLGPLTDVGGYPAVTGNSPRNNKYTIDLDKDFPGQKIEIKTFKEFVGVKIVGASAESFGDAIGITGDFKTGNTYARDGSTVLHDFNELGLEWQVLPSDGKLFHEMARPHSSQNCATFPRILVAHVLVDWPNRISPKKLRKLLVLASRMSSIARVASMISWPPKIRTWSAPSRDA